jgi:hypothetical protein
MLVAFDVDLFAIFQESDHRLLEVLTHGIFVTTEVEFSGEFRVVSKVNVFASNQF